MNYLLVASDKKTVNNQILSANMILDFRLKSGRWPIYLKTMFKDAIKSNDKCIVYVAGKYETRQSFVTDFIIKDIEKNSTLENLENKKLYINTPVPIFDLIFEPTRIKNIINAKNLINHLDLTNNLLSNAWGLPFRSGVNILTDRDYNFLLNKIKS